MSCFRRTALVTAIEGTGEERREEISGDIAATATIVIVHKKIVEIIGDTPLFDRFEPPAKEESSL